MCHDARLDVAEPIADGHLYVQNRQPDEPALLVPEVWISFQAAFRLPAAIVVTSSSMSRLIRASSEFPDFSARRRRSA